MIKDVKLSINDKTLVLLSSEIVYVKVVHKLYKLLLFIILFTY